MHARDTVRHLPCGASRYAIEPGTGSGADHRGHPGAPCSRGGSLSPWARQEGTPSIRPRSNPPLVPPRPFTSAKSPPCDPHVSLVSWEPPQLGFPRGAWCSLLGDACFVLYRDPWSSLGTSCLPRTRRRSAAPAIPAMPPSPIPMSCLRAATPQIALALALQIKHTSPATTEMIRNATIRKMASAPAPLRLRSTAAARAGCTPRRRRSGRRAPETRDSSACRRRIGSMH